MNTLASRSMVVVTRWVYPANRVSRVPFKARKAIGAVALRVAICIYRYTLWLQPKKVTPAERGNAPGVVINADEGNVNEQDFKP